MSLLIFLEKGESHGLLLRKSSISGQSAGDGRNGSYVRGCMAQSKVGRFFPDRTNRFGKEISAEASGRLHRYGIRSGHRHGRKPMERPAKSLCGEAGPFGKRTDIQGEETALPERARVRRPDPLSCCRRGRAGLWRKKRRRLDGQAVVLKQKESVPCV